MTPINKKAACPCIKGRPKMEIAYVIQKAHYDKGFDPLNRKMPLLSLLKIFTFRNTNNKFQIFTAVNLCRAGIDP